MNFMKYRYLFFVISLFFLVPGIFSLIRFGLRPAIDFTGGSLIEVQLAQPAADLSRETVQQVIGESYEVSSVLPANNNQVILRGKPIQNAQKDEVITKLKETYGPLRELRFESVGPTLGKELLQKTFVAAALVSLLITLYVWRQFQSFKFGIAAILAMFHDSLILLGAFSILGWWKGVEVDVLFVTALLTTLSFSVHDTIVVFDRIREMLRKHPRAPFINVANAAVIETLGRSINNSMTIIIMLLSLVLLGGETIRWFAVALLIGAITGTYSSTFTAVPLVVVWDEVMKRRKEKK